MTDRQDFLIDELRLDWEWNRQANLAYSYGEHQADCQSEYDKAKNALELAKAEADREIRQRPKAFEIDKKTEKAIEAAVPKHPSVKHAHEEVIEARHALDVAKAACNAIEHKKRGLEKAVDLFLAGYYSEPRASSDNKEAVDEMKKRDLRGRARRRKRREET